MMIRYLNNKNRTEFKIATFYFIEKCGFYFLKIKEGEGKKQGLQMNM